MTSRRDALKLFATGAAFLTAGCRAPEREIVPYRDMPEGLVPGRPMFFATSLPLAGAGRGVVVESHEGRPTKVHGNALHPAGLGGTDVFAEAELLALFDPSRPRTVLHEGRPESWGTLQAVLADALAGDGAGVALVTGPVGSPTLARQIDGLMAAKPELGWYGYRTVAPELEAEIGGRIVQVWPDFAGVDTVVTLSADPLGPGPGQVAFAKRWAAAKRDRRATFRSFAFEARPTLTGAQADRRVAVRPSELPDVLAALEAGEGEAAQALARGNGLVLGGAGLAPQVHARIAALNRRNDAPVGYLRPFWDWPGLSPQPVEALMEAMARGTVRALIVLGANPVYDFGPAFAEAMMQVPLRMHFGVDAGETARLCQWHGPLNHPLEDWSDLRAIEGSVGLLQPLIAPLHDSRSAHEVVSMMTQVVPEPAQDLVRESWAKVWAASEFEDRWKRSLHDGVIDGVEAERTRLPEALGGPGPAVAGAPPSASAEARPDGEVEVIVAASPSVLDGTYAGNGWLQECPEPFTKQVWGNAVWVAPEDALRLGLSDGDAVRLGHVTGPAIVVPGQAAGSATVFRGYGREAAGEIGSGVGFAVTGVEPTARLERIGGTVDVIRTQTEFGQHGRDILKTVPSVNAALEPQEPLASFYGGWDYPEAAWGMVIDTDACIGCNACMIACQSENNVPVVGPDEVARGRHMHWIRVDAYEMDVGLRGFQPVPCMHCEKAPCEPVCPTAASVHDGEGLNVQVYNRCIGTRFCQANCPYKVRRFNFFDYADGQAFATLGADLLKARANPDVSVRGRGVMEKCTYCVQRIAAAHHDAAAEAGDLPEVVTACQSACPADAITFGDLNDPASAVRRARSSPRHYALLHELGTEPRTTYLARVVPDEGEPDEGET